MHGIVDIVLVGLALLTSVVYAAVSLGPRTLRHGLLARAAAVLARMPRGFGAGNLALRLQTAAQAKAKGSCGGCDSCGSTPATAAPGATAPGAAAPGARTEVRIPMSQIGRR